MGYSSDIVDLGIFGIWGYLGFFGIFGDIVELFYGFLCQACSVEAHQYDPQLRR